MHFTDRADAGRRLAAALTTEITDPRRTVVVALPRGGAPVAAEVAAALGAELDVCVVRKVGVPGQPEVAMGAVGEDGARVVNQEVVDAAGVTPEAFAAVEARERTELARRAAVYRRGRPPVPLAGRTVLVVDDGVATGASALAACRIVRARGAARVVLAVPVAPHDWARRLGGAADGYVAVHAPEGFGAVGEFYRDFRQTTDAEVLAALDRPRPPDAGQDGDAGRDTGFEVPLAAGPAEVAVPADPLGVVLFAHGSGSGRDSPRNRAVARQLRRAGLATVLFDLLAPGEAEEPWKVFDPGLLGGRLVEATRTVLRHHALAGLPYGWFGASTGAAAALWAAAEPDTAPAAIVARGGRPDLAQARLSLVTTPVLLIVGGADPEVVELNRRARAELRGESALQVVPGAGHLFEEPGALAAVAELAARWFVRRLPSAEGDDRPRS
ncbi:phosphoribosyltransferase family protein [Kitasatospora phosalacinea]|uniref:phosphoribosyltransferase family protein n=1 Tax=Kitasatospora phosalacinea TaxID=2065 RepID=UPI000525FE64|nr:phosphoribosyltransferase family protein [Kitasatospora phosalacinea]